MDHGVRGIAYRGRQDGRPGRYAWFLVVSALNLMLWSGVIVLITRS
jgi:hypothetical protein